MRLWQWVGFWPTVSDGAGAYSFFVAHLFVTYTFHRAFLLQVPLSLLAIVSVSLSLHLPKAQVGLEGSEFTSKLKRVDFSGAVTLVLSVFCLLFALNRGGNISWSDNLTVISFVGFSVLAVFFGIIEMKLASEPFAPKRIIFNRSLIAANLVNLFGMAAGMSMIFHVSLYLQAVDGKSASEAGKWLILTVVGSLIGSLGGGLTLQATGKYFTLTVAGYGTLFLGNLIVVLMVGVLKQSDIGVAIGACPLLVLVFVHDSSPVS